MTHALEIMGGYAPFLLTRPSRDVTAVFMDSKLFDSISTHTSLAGRDIIRSYKIIIMFMISTHTSLAGRDDSGTQTGSVTGNFYSHVPRGT